MSSPRIRGALALAAAALLLATSGLADAGKKKRKAETYWFKVAAVKLAEGIPEDVGAQIKKQLGERIEAHSELVSKLAGAPDPAKEPKKFKRYLARKKMRAFKVNVEVTLYVHELEQLEAPRRGQRLTVSVELRTFGESIPDRGMAFSGEGSATVKLDIGNKLRKRDSEVGRHDAFELAIDKALNESIRKLRMPPPAKPTKK